MLSTREPSPPLSPVVGFQNYRFRKEFQPGRSPRTPSTYHPTLEGITTMFSSSTHPRSRRRPLLAAPLWLIALFLTLAQHAAAVRDDGDRGETHIVAVVAMAVAALALSLLVGPKIFAWVSDQLAAFG